MYHNTFPALYDQVCEPGYLVIAFNSTCTVAETAKPLKVLPVASTPGLSILPTTTRTNKALTSTPTSSPTTITPSTPATTVAAPIAEVGFSLRKNEVPATEVAAFHMSSPQPEMLSTGSAKDIAVPSTFHAEEEKPVATFVTGLSRGATAAEFVAALAGKVEIMPATLYLLPLRNIGFLSVRNEEQANILMHLDEKLYVRGRNLNFKLSTSTAGPNSAEPVDGIGRRPRGGRKNKGGSSRNVAIMAT